MENITVNAGSVIAMQGKQCIGMASDLRFGQTSRTLGENYQKVFNMGPHVILGLTGLQTDVLTVCTRLKYRKVAYEINMGHIISPKILSELLSQMLYEHRFGPFFIECLVVGLDPDTSEPYMCCLDQIGSCVPAANFSVLGCGTDQLIGMCDNVWVPDLDGEQLFEALSMVMLSSSNRDAFNGLGCSIIIAERDKVTDRVVNTRKD